MKTTTTKFSGNLNRKTILMSLLFSTTAALTPTAVIAQEPANPPDEMFYDIDNTAQVILTPDKCKYEPQLFAGRIVNKDTSESLYVCWYLSEEVVHIQGVDEKKNVYDFHYYAKRFQPRWY